MNLKLPPYAKQAISRSDWHEQSCIWIYMGWGQYRTHYEGPVQMGAHPASINVVIPEDESPLSFDWGWVDGRSVVLVGWDQHEERVDELVSLLAEAGTDEVTWLASKQIVPVRIARREVMV